MAAYAPAFSERNEELTVQYVFGKKLGGDTEVSSLDELKAIGGSSTYFYIHVGGWNGGSVNINDTLSPDVRLGVLAEQTERAVHQQIEVIFQHRVLALRNAVAQLPSRLRFALWMIAFLLPAIIFSPPGSLSMKIALGMIYAALLLGGLIYFNQPSRVVFVDSYEKSRESVETRKDILNKIIFALLGAGLTLIVQVIFKKWF